METAVAGDRQRQAPAPPAIPPGVDEDGAASAVDVEPEQPAPAPAMPAGVVVDGATTDADFIWELRKYVLLLATLAATVTYSAGLNPPGGFWGKDDGAGGERLAGEAVLRVTYPRRYKVFFYFNGTAFVASLVIVNLLLVGSLSHRRRWLRTLQAVMILDMFALMGSYAAGSSREEAMSTYVLVALVALYFCAHVLVFWFLALREPDRKRTPRAPESVERSRKHLLVLATLSASITYQAGLSTPDSQEDNHLAGDPLVRVHQPDRFTVFFYSNGTAFLASLVVIVLLMNKTVRRHGIRSWAHWVCACTAMVGLIGALATGSCRGVKTSIYVVALVAAVFFYIVIQALVFLENLIHTLQETLERYLKFKKLEQQIHQQRSSASGQASGDDYQILKRSQKHLLLLGILAASVTYQAGLNPPGGLWQGDAAGDHHHHRAGDPILHITYHRRYLAFFYCNATAFVASLVIIVLLLTNVFSTQGIRYCALQVAMILELLGLIGAYAAGSCLKVSKSVYVSVLVVPVFLYVGIHVVVFVLQVFPECVTWRGELREKLELWLEKVFEHAGEGEVKKRRKLRLLLANLRRRVLRASVQITVGNNVDSSRARARLDKVWSRSISRT